MPCKLEFCQPLSPVANNLFLSFHVGFIPILIALVLLGIVRRPAWQAALAGLVVSSIIAVLVWQTPIGLAASSTLDGIALRLRRHLCCHGHKNEEELNVQSGT